MDKLYPINAKNENSDNPAIRIYGNRIHADQSIYEYLIEFLLVFSSAKELDGSGKMQFHSNSPLYYYVEPRNGFRRFVFYEQARKNKNIEADKKAYKDIIRILSEHVDASKDSEKEQFVLAVQDLFHGYAAILKKRSWCAQALLPLCPEMILCEEMPNDKVRLKGPDSSWSVSEEYDSDNTFYDASFDLTRHNFLARGGEMYYLHLLQALERNSSNKERLSSLLKDLLTDKSSDFSKLANWIQETWQTEQKIDPQKLVYRMSMGYLPNGSYIRSGLFAVNELVTYLSNELHPVKRIEILSKGLMLQIMRMQVERTEEYLGLQRLPWIIDMRGKESGQIVKQLSSQSFSSICDSFTTAINKYIVSQRADDTDDLQNENSNPVLTDEYKLLVRAKKESVDVFKGKGKEIQCIIPTHGPNERFSLSEDLVKFLVLSIVAPGKKMDLNQFLAKLYEQFAFVIGPEEYKKSIDGSELSIDLTNSFISNKEAFQIFLKDAGFLRALSDATSIVVNPYKEVDLK